MTGATFTTHAYERIIERGIHLDEAIQLLQFAHRVYPVRKYHSDSVQFWKNKNNIFIVDASSKKVITYYKTNKSLFL